MAVYPTGDTSFLVTGASRGLGLEICRQLLEEHGDAVVIAGARNPPESRDLCELQTEFQGRLQVVKIDLTDAEGVRAAMQEVDSLLPEGLDYLVCNAGITGDRVNASDETPQTVRSVFDTNIFGTLTIITEAMPLLRRGHKKMILCMSSCAGSLTNGQKVASFKREWSRVFMGYKMSKSAMNMMVQTLAADLEEEGFTLAAMHPGWAMTDMGKSAADVLDGVIPPVDPRTCVAHLIQTLTSFPIERSGAFIGSQGEDLPW